MDEKLLPTTRGTLDATELKKMLNSAYGAFCIPDVSTNIDMGELYPKHLVAEEDIPTYMNDQAWLDIGKPYVIPYNIPLSRGTILAMADRMIADAGYPDKENVRILASADIMRCLSRFGGLPRCTTTRAGLTLAYDDSLQLRGLKLQQKRVTMSYDQFFKVQPWGEKLSTPVTVPEPQYRVKHCLNLSDDLMNDLNDATTRAITALRDCFKNINMEDTDMLGKSVEIKKVIYSGPCTIVIWKDGDKTIVRQQDGDTYSKEVGLLMCLAKRVWGKNESGSNFNDYMRKYVSEEK